MAKQCAVNRDVDGKVTSVEVQNLGNGISADYSYIDDFLATVKDTELYREVSKFKDVYKEAVDNYINSKESNNQIMRDLEILTKSEFFNTLAELEVPIKLPITAEQYSDIKADIDNGATKKQILEKYKVGGDVFKFLSKGSKVEFITEKKKVRESVSARNIEESIAKSIIADRVAGMNITELYDKYHLPLQAITNLLRLNDIYVLKIEGGIVRNIYAGNKGRIPYQSAKLGKWITGDSNYEIARFIELDADPNVLSYTRDVDPIPYKDSTGKGRGYHPDILVTYTDGRIEVEEIKPAMIIKNGDLIRQLRAQGLDEDAIRHELNLSKTMYNIVSKNVDKIDTVREYYAEQGIPFKIMTEKEINVKLSDYSSLTKLSAKDKRQIKKEQKVLELKEKEFLNSQLYDELKQQPFIDENQALDAYKNIYSDDLNEWKNQDLDC
jgi:hypothetical protein